MQVSFVERSNGPERLVCDAELAFDSDDGPLNGLKLVGFALWRGADGEVHVTFPSRPFAVGGDRRFFDYLRSSDGTPTESRRLKTWIVEQFQTSKSQ